MAAKKSKNAEVKYYGTGRRKSSVARVYLQAGEGKITVNGRDADEFFPHDTLVIDVKQPLSLTGNIDKFDVIAFVIIISISSLSIWNTVHFQIQIFNFRISPLLGFYFFFHG